MKWIIKSTITWTENTADNKPHRWDLVLIYGAIIAHAHGTDVARWTECEDDKMGWCTFSYYRNHDNCIDDTYVDCWALLPVPEWIHQNKSDQ